MSPRSNVLLDRAGPGFSRDQLGPGLKFAIQDGRPGSEMNLLTISAVEILLTLTKEALGSGRTYFCLIQVSI